MKNYYRILELSENASKEVIEKAYKALAKKYHPDTKVGISKQKAEEKLKEINEAYSVLSDDFLKEQYDKELSSQRQKSQAGDQNKDQIKQQENMQEEKKNPFNIIRKKKNQQDNGRKRRISQTPEAGMIGLIKQLFVVNPFWKNIPKAKIDVLALVLTIIIMISIGIILFVLPYTHDWMMDNFIDTPLTQAIVKLFSR